MKRTLSAVVIASVVLLTTISTAPAQATTATVTDLAILKIAHLDVTTGSRTVAAIGDAMRFKVFAENLGPDVAPMLRVYPNPSTTNFVLQSLVCVGGAPSSLGGCAFTNVPRGLIVHAFIYGYASGTSYPQHPVVKQDTTVLNDATVGQTDPTWTNNERIGHISLTAS